MKTNHWFAALLMAFAGSVMTLGQAVPQLVNYQGQLLNAAGVPLPTGDYDVEVSLFAVESGGAPLWGPQRFNGQNGPGLGAKVPVVDGRFNLILGPEDMAENDLGRVFSANASIFIELKVGGGAPIAPRQQMLSAPYAFQALTAGGLKGAEIFVDGKMGIGAPPEFGYALEVTGGATIRAGGTGGPILFGTPSLETGFTMGILNRADIRFDDSTLKLLAGSGRNPRGAETGIAIATSGFVGVGTHLPQHKLHVIGNIRASGTINSDSDVNAKTDFATVDTSEILQRVLELRIQKWRFKAENTGVEHVGPMAQDFRAAFGLGEGSTSIATVDADGVSLAAIQGLSKVVQQKDAEIQELKKGMAELEARMEQLAGQLNQISRAE